MSTERRKPEQIIALIPEGRSLLVHFSVGDTPVYIGRQASYEEVVSRLATSPAQVPDADFNRQIFNNHLIAKGYDENGSTFWVSVRRPGEQLAKAWPYEINQSTTTN